MKKINVGDTVVLIKDGEIVEGIVKRVVDLVNPPILAVDINGDIEKVSAKAVTLVQKEETRAEDKSEVETNEIKSSVIRCTKDRYAEALKKVTVTDVVFPRDIFKAGRMLTEYKLAIAIGFEVGNNLIGDNKEIDLDKYVLLWSLVREIIPSKLAKTAEVGDACDFEDLSGALIEIFMNFITELFGAENE